MKHTCKNKLFIAKKQAFTLIELLIVIAIIGILFIVLVSKVDFATDKAKATGVQTDFRSFQMAFDTIAKENAGFNTFGWDTGDLNQDGKRNSYDEGDNGAGGGTAKNGIQDGTEVFTGHKVYAETFTKVYSLKKAKADGTLEPNYDRDALNRLETAINANLDPKLHITIKDDGEIVMANGAQDPWNKEYHGYYITNAEVDKKDRGAIVMYSDGANNEFGSEHTIANGVVTITVPGSNKAGKDDYSIVSCYTYVNGYGEVLNITTGFSNNQGFLGNNNNNPTIVPDGGSQPDAPDNNTEPVVPGMIEFTIGKFESTTNYLPGQHETVPYEVTKIREKQPVSSVQNLMFSLEFEGTDLATLNPYMQTYQSKYIVYRISKAQDNENGSFQTHADHRYIYNVSDDTLENAIYLAAYVQKSVSDTNGGRYYPYHIAEWNGSAYVKVDYRAQIDAITDFTETYIDIEYKVVEITKPSSNTNYVYIPSGTMIAEEGMTWSEWISSSYNTLDYAITSVFDADYNTINLSAAIISGHKYGFTVTEKISLPWPMRYNSIELENHPNSIISPIDNTIKLVKLCDYVPTKEDMESLHVFAMPKTESVYMGWELEEYVSMDGVEVYNYMWHDWNSGYGIGFIVVDTPNTQIAEIGLTIEEPGLYIFVGWSIVPGTDIIIDAPMCPESSEMNEYGFFYDYEYYACDYESNMASLVFREDGSSAMYYEEQSQISPAGTATYGTKTISVDGFGVGTVSSDGTQIYFPDIDLRFSIIGMSKKR